MGIFWLVKFPAVIIITEYSSPFSSEFTINTNTAPIPIASPEFYRSLTSLRENQTNTF
jgi:hypothetical protein